MESQNCPHCSARLYNPAPGRDGVVRCTSCGTPIGGGAVVAASVAGVARRSEESRPSPEPKPSSYAFLAAFGYVFVLANILLGFWMASWVWMDRFPPIGRGGAAFSNLILWTAVAPFVMLALGVVVLHVCLLPKRLDLAALRYAARHRGLSGLKFPVERSGLDIFGPFLVIGGLFVVYSLLAAATDEVTTLVRESSGIVAGLVLFFFGLAVADLCRLLWRMEFLAQQMTEGKKYPPQRPGFMRSLRHAFPLVILAAGILSLKGCFETGIGYAYSYERSSGWLVVMGLVCLACWSLYRLSSRWLSCLETWGLVGPVREKRFADRASRWWGMAAFIGGLVVAFFGQYVWVMFSYRSSESSLGLLQWVVMLYLAILPVLLHRASAIARGLSPGCSAAGLMGLPRGWVSWAFGVILVGGILGSILILVETLTYFSRSGYFEMMFVLMLSSLPVATAVWIVGLLSPIHFMVVQLESAAADKPKDVR